MAGRDIPFTLSEELKKLNLNCEVIHLKIASEQDQHNRLYLTARIIAKEDFRANPDYKEIYDGIMYRVVASDGSNINTGIFPLRSLSGNNAPPYLKGQSIRHDGKDETTYFDISENTEKWVDFAGIELITDDEYRALD